jgi:hypothetical protein
MSESWISSPKTMGVDLLGWEISMQPQIPGLLADGVLISFTAIALTILGITYFLFKDPDK